MIAIFLKDGFLIDVLSKKFDIKEDLILAYKGLTDMLSLNLEQAKEKLKIF